MVVDIKKIGICFGGYCPLHQGHMDVIMQAKKENDICYVIVCGYDNEPRGWEINLNLDERYNLINKFFEGDEQIKVRKINDTELGLDESMSDNNWRIWQNSVKHFLGGDWIYPAEDRRFKITWYVAEPFYKRCIERNNVLKEVYGNYASVDVKLINKDNPVSGTQVRKNPVRYWNKITRPFKEYLCKNILVIGTASEGKTTLVNDIAKYFDIKSCPEYGRVYMEERHITDTDLTYKDFDIFLDGQFTYSKAIARTSTNGISISDTDNTVTLMYALAYVEDPNMKITIEDYDKLHAHALRLKDKIKWDHIFIFPPSKKFVDDGCRYMGQASMEEREKNFIKLQKLVEEFYPEVSKTYLNGSFLDNFNEVKKYINSLIEG